MGCGGSKATANGAVSNHNPQLQVTGLDSPHEERKNISFEIPLTENDEVNESIVKKHPPKKLQQLQDRPQLTMQELEEKQKDVEERRKMILQDRVRSSREQTERYMKRKL